jgi:phospholipase C
VGFCSQRSIPNAFEVLAVYNPGYFGNGNNAYLDQNPANMPFTIPPSSTPSLGDLLNTNNLSWKLRR